jgi:hypothetical protein
MHGAQLVEPDVEELADVQCLSARRVDRGVQNREGEGQPDPARRREPAELAVLHSPPPIGRYEASDSHEVIVTCFGSDDRES